MRRREAGACSKQSGSVRRRKARQSLCSNRQRGKRQGSSYVRLLQRQSTCSVLLLPLLLLVVVVAAAQLLPLQMFALFQHASMTPPPLLLQQCTLYPLPPP